MPTRIRVVVAAQPAMIVGPSCTGIDGSRGLRMLSPVHSPSKPASSANPAQRDASTQVPGLTFSPNRMRVPFRGFPGQPR
jgi:hypothetical protein